MRLLRIITNQSEFLVEQNLPINMSLLYLVRILSVQTYNLFSNTTRLKVVTPCYDVIGIGGNPMRVQKNVQDQHFHFLMNLPNISMILQVFSICMRIGVAL